MACVVVQQLAYAGVTNWTFVETDETSESNLNRLVTATPADVGRPKIDVAFRLVTSLHPGSQPTMIQGRIGDPEITEALNQALATATLAIGCFDLETPKARDSTRRAHGPACRTWTLHRRSFQARSGGSTAGALCSPTMGRAAPSCLGVIDMARTSPVGGTDWEPRASNENRMPWPWCRRPRRFRPRRSHHHQRRRRLDLPCTEVLVFSTSLRTPCSTSSSTTATPLLYART